MNNNVHCQLNTESDFSIKHLEKIDKVKLTHTKKVARGVSVKKFQLKGEVICNASFGGKIVKAKAYVLNNMLDLFCTD